MPELSDQDKETTSLKQPVQPGERILALDVLRGFALCGVLIANTLWSLGSPPNEPLGDVETVVNRTLLLLIAGKFLTLFAFLFGLGFSIQLLRAEERSQSIVPVYVRRLLALLLIGVPHAIFLRQGDVLVPYAITGFFLLLFRKASNRTVIIAAILSFFVQIPLSWLKEAIGFKFPPMPDTTVMGYVEGNYALFQALLPRLIYTGWSSYLGLFLLGLYIGRKRIFENVAKYRSLLWKGVVVGLVVGLPLNFAFAPYLAYKPTVTAPVAKFFFGLLGILISNAHYILLASFYAAGILLLMQSSTWRRVFDPFSAIGRMALTNYLLQSIIIVPVCLAFGLLGTFTPTRSLLLALAVFAFQVPFSMLWLKYFDFGPFEWIWRSLTYWKIQRLRKRQIAEPSSLLPIPEPQF